MQTIITTISMNNSMDRTAHFYAQPSYVRGGIMPVFSGSRRQRGGSILGALKSVFMPVLRTVGRKAVQGALGLATDVIGDVTSGQDFASSIKRRGVNRAKRLGGDILSTAVKQVKTAIGPGQRAPATRRAAPSRKRRAPTKTKQTAKRRRANF